MTLAEALVVTLIVALLTAFAGTYGLRWLRSERLRSSLYQTYVQVNLARVEAVNRNRACRFTIDTSTLQLSVIDLNDPGVATDDEVILQQALPSRTLFTTPTASPAVTLENPAGSLFQVTFSRDGSVSSGSGSIHIGDGTDFRRVSVFAGGGVAVERWNGSSWETGS